MTHDSSDWNPQPVIDWLLHDGRLMADRDQMIAELSLRILNEGVPLCRLRLSFRTVHPLIAGLTTSWERDADEITSLPTPYGFQTNDAFIGSPIAIIARTGQPFRRRLDEQLQESDHRLLHELKARGMTDYFGRALTFTSGPGAMMLFNSDAPGGFSEADIAGLNRIADVMAPIVEVFNARLIALAVAEAYLGPRTGRRVLDGQITRGDIETLNAAILVSDIRGWTRLNQTHSTRDAVDLANRYFEQMAETIDAQGGEILKFLGDGLLAIFPDDAEQGDPCIRALSAAKAACDSDIGDVRFGIGLHYGEVLYGNIGSQSRIDFTVLGQAVNIAARIEGLCGQLGEPILFSQAFADRLDKRVIKVSDEALKGIEGTLPIYRV